MDISLVQVDRVDWKFITHKTDCNESNGLQVLNDGIDFCCCYSKRQMVTVFFFEAILILDSDADW